MTASTCTIVSATEVSVEYTTGVPVSDAVIAPVLRLMDDCNAALLTSCTAASLKNKLVVGTTAALTEPTNPLSITSAAERNVVSSFAGGRRLVIDAKGLATNMQANRASIKVCGKECVFDASNSDAATVACDVPYIDTLNSIESFANAEIGQIFGTQIESKSGLAATVFDGTNLPSISSSGSNCFVGQEFETDSTTSFVGKLTELKFYMDFFSDKSVYKDKLKF